jgi:hypothetical protein
MKVDNFWQLSNTFGDTNVVIAVLGMGVEITHEDLSDNIWINWNEIPNNGIDDDGNGYIDDYNGWNVIDDNGNVMPDGLQYTHETNIAGIIAATMNNNKGIVGIAPNCKILPVKFFNEAHTYQQKAEYLRDAFNYVRDLQLQFPEKRFIINLSYEFRGFTGSHITMVSSAILECYNLGIPIFCGSGNNEKVPIAFPGNSEQTITIAALLSGIDNLFNFFGNEHCIGPENDFAAASEAIKTTTFNNGYDSFNGTSMASPVAAGIAALLLSVRNDLTPAQIKTIMKLTSEQVGDVDYYWNLNLPGHSQELGYGKLNAEYCLTRGLLDINFANNVEGNTNNFGQIKINDQWQPTNTTLPFILNDEITLEAENVLHNYNNYDNRFYNWSVVFNPAYSRNLNNIIVADYELQAVHSLYKKTKPLTVRNYLEGGDGGIIKFGESGIGALLNDFIDRGSPFQENAFLYNQLGQVLINYKAEANQTHNLLNTTWRFYRWENGSANRIREEQINVSSPSEWKAIYKGIQRSDDQSAYTNNSQRKFVRTNDGIIYSLYESLNRVWLEKSTDNGSTWSIINNGNPLKNADSRNPSMCLTYYNGLIIVFETEGLIWIYQYNPTTNNAYERTSIYSCTIAPYESNPVVTYCFNGDAPATGPVVIWKSYGNDAFCGDAGLYYALINADNWSVSPEAIITNTDINSYDPSIAGNDPIHNESIWRSDPMKFNLVWEQRGSVNSSIMFYQVERLANNALDFTDFQNISAFNGYSKNYKPSIISIKDDNDNLGSRVVWLAERYQAEEERLEKGQGSENTEGVQYKTFFKDVGVSGFRSYGNKSNAPTINKLNNNSDYYLAFSEQSNLAGKVVIGSDPTTINQLETIGKDIQMGNGANENQAIALAFHSANLPYYFNRSANMSNVTPKIKSLAIVSGREGVVGKDTAQFYFTVGDVILDDQPIEFIELPDTALINGKEILNEYLVTNPFTLNDNSAFYYSVQYGITDSASAIQALTDSVFINFTVQLLDANTDEIIGTFDNVTYNSDSVFIYNNIAYQVNVSGLNNRLVKLRLKTETNHQFDYSLTQRYAEESVLGKKFIKQINFNAGVIITEYALEQNYPNPFNPITTIRYQLPQDGMVTLKVYDILGSEVATLVNEQKTSGRYEVNFDASRLASGVYIYKLTSGSYVSSKKMLLVK